MRYILTLLAVLLCAAPAFAGTSLQLRASSGDLEFGFLYSDHYRAEPSVMEEHGSWISESDFLVALHLGQQSDTGLSVILEWRRDGKSWDEITRRCHLDTRTYYVELPEDSGPPYGRAWGHWKKSKQEPLSLNDDEIRAFVELRALSEYSGQSPAEVLRQKKNGASPAAIAKNGKGGKKGAAASPAGKSKGKGKH